MVLFRFLGYGALLLTTAVRLQAIPLDRAYEALRVRDYDAAIAHFLTAIEAEPSRASAHKDLAYTYLKAGETEAARDRFAEAMRLDPTDDHTALEYAFLCYETKQQAVARRVFDRLRRKGNRTAGQAFATIDGQLAEGIERWSKAADLSPGNYSVHQELARLAEQRNDLALAASHYHRAWQLRPDLRSLLLDLGRVRKAAGDASEATRALLAASRSTEARVAETARELLPSRYPYVYEFSEALTLDPRNVDLRRELAYLRLAMGDPVEAEAEFRRVIDADPDDALSAAQLGFLLLARKQMAEGVPLLERALKAAAETDDDLADRIRTALGYSRALRKRPDAPRSRTSVEARYLAERSLQAGYLRDALKYLTIAHENDPADFDVISKLGWTFNLLGDDRQAVEWFRLARKSPDPGTAADAKRAFDNLHPAFARFRTTAWAFPMYSSRWKDVFLYSQFKTELMPNRPVQLYLSTRLVGDVRGKTRNPLTGWNDLMLSENSAVLALGVSTRPWQGVRAWFESGASISGATVGDHRGGVSGLRTFGRNIGARTGGVFGEFSGDLLFASRFSRDTLLYGRGRGGYTFRAAGPAQVQASWNLNRTIDVRGFSWANIIETGPGVRLYVRGWLLSVDAVRGKYTVLDGTRPARYDDLRVGLWYAFTR